MCWEWHEILSCASLSAGVKRFVYVSAADFGLVNYLLRGYYEGKVLSCSMMFSHKLNICKTLNVLRVETM